ncbi:MAG: 3-methyl-2-oxobutanoate hydroxymethyltransferase [Deltaproteobacteria bacterium]|nr:3-methyl-2-oxobutanoate hydroxymethyltransferase [Deltaproteobacteria bacterium]
MNNRVRKKVTIKDLFKMKAQKRRIVALGVYDYPTAMIADKLDVEILFTGPSGPMSLFGHRFVRSIRPSEMLVVTRAVSRVEPRALLVASLPYMTYEMSNERAIETAALFVTEGGADCVKCDANRHLAERIQAIVRSGIPVMAHIGLQASRQVEQSGYRVQGRTAEHAMSIVQDAQALVKAGVFAILVEAATQELTSYLTNNMPVPIIGLSSGDDIDGGCIVSGDAVGYSVSPKPPKAARFVDVKPKIQKALLEYEKDARSGEGPSFKNFTRLPEDEWLDIHRELQL